MEESKHQSDIAPYVINESIEVSVQSDATATDSSVRSGKQMKVGAIVGGAVGRREGETEGEVLGLAEGE